MQQFLTDSLEGRYVKAVLDNIALPRFNTVSESDYLIAGITYIYRNDIILCTKSGYLESFKDEPKAQFDLVGDYKLGDTISKISSKYIANAGYYDTDTHRALGKYLRYIRDIYHLDYMSMYNCYANEYSSKYKLSISGGVEQLTNTTNKVYMVPILFNKTYSIAIDSIAPVIICAAFLHKGSLLTVEDTSFTDMLRQAVPDYTKVALNTNFRNPITYTLDLSSVDDSTRYKLSRYQEKLYMMVQVPITNDSSFVVLEGDYTNCDKRYIFNNVDKVDEDGNIVDIKAELSWQQLDKRLSSRPSLLVANDHKIYAFSDNLLGYLIGMTITKDESIKNNILRVQNGIFMSGYYNDSEFQKDIWDDDLRKLLFNRFLDKYPYSYDVTGYVDRKMEKFLLDGLNYTAGDF